MRCCRSKQSNVVNGVDSDDGTFKSCVCRVGGVAIRFVIDVGAKVSLINRNTFKSSFKDIPINPTTIQLTAY